MATIDLIINAETKKATKSITNFAGAATKSIKSMESAFTGFKAVAAGAVAFLGARALVNNIKELTDAASVQEDAINSLNTALRLAGDYSDEAS